MVRTLATVMRELAALGCGRGDRAGPVPHPALPDLPRHPAVVLPRRRLARLMDGFAPDALHISTEGPLGHRRARAGAAPRLAFTTAFHTRFPEYLHARTRLPTGLAYAWLRRFHGAGAGLMVATDSLRQELAARGFRNIRPWSRGVDLHSSSRSRARRGGLPRPVFAYVGRVAVEKNIAAFLASTCPAPRWWWATARPARAQPRFPRCISPASGMAQALAQAYAGADVLVFPS